MAFCPNCGTELREGVKFCENCGAPVAIAPIKETVAEAPVYEEPVYEQPVYEQPAYEEPVVVNNAEQNGAAKSALIMSIVGLVLSEFGLPGIIVCAIAKGKVKKAIALGATGAKVKVAKILSTIGLIISIFMTIFWTLYILVIGGAAIYGISNGSFDELSDLISY